MKPHVEVAVAFASALVEGDFAGASLLLAPALRKQFPPDILRERFHAMFRGYSDSEPIRIHYDEESSLTDWFGKPAGDVGTLYVGIEGEDFLEAVDVMIADFDGHLLIRDVIWGRP